MLDIVRRAADRIGGVPRLAQRIGVTRQAIYQWREVPADRVGEIATATGIPRADLRPDLFALSEDEQAWQRDVLGNAAPAADFTDLRRDRVAWSEAQVSAIAAGALSDIDTDQLVALLRSLGNDARVDIERRLAVIMVRLLKWQYRSDRRSLSTVGVITAERARIFSRFAASPSLRTHAETALAGVYISARAQASDETGLDRDVFPIDCPFGLDELLDPSFAPAAKVA
jgi:DNA-binding transcriptional regulator YdaS (Cro superfamily)